MKIVIEASGGVVNQVYASEPDVTVDLLDWDDVAEGASLSEAEQAELLAETTKETPHLARWECQPRTTMNLNIPEHENDGEKYPGGIKPGDYGREDVVKLLRDHKGDSEAIQFIADMLANAS
jgi:hypothetical protein